MNRRYSSRAVALVAAGLVGTALPLPSAQAEQNFGGYTSEAWAAPIKIEIYEPTIPIPAEPQAELEVGYTNTEAATGTGNGRSSFLWPGDPVGEGFKTFAEALGLPKEVGAQGYPVQVNSSHPGGPESQAQEPFPGMVMRTSASAKETVARVGFSPDGQVSGDKQVSGDDGDTPGVPGLPGADATGGDPLTQLGDVLKGLGGGTLLPGQKASTGGSAAADEDTPAAPGLPPELAALVDAEGISSISESVTGGDVIRSTATSRIGNLSLLGGVITVDFVTTTATTISDGTKAAAQRKARIGGLEIAGQSFGFGPDGIEASGKPAPIPGLPDDPAKALEALGVSLVLPKGEKSVDGASAENLVEGLQVVIDTKVLRSKLDAVPFDQIIGAIPDQAGELKNLLGAAVNLAPKFVITLGNSATTTSTVPAIELPDIDPGHLPAGGADGSGGTPAVPGAGGSDVGSGSSGTDLGSGSAAPPAGTSAAAAASAAAGAGDALAAEPMSAGLPPLASVPGALMVGGLVLATGIGWWLQKIGAFVLGGAGSCAHGLETGVPDLRKA